MKMNINRLYIVLAATCCVHSAGAQEFGLEYTTELQTRFKKEANWVNRLQLEASVDIGKYFSVQAASVSTATTVSEPLIYNMITFSNIEEENIPFAFKRLGCEFHTGDWQMFAGVSNMNDNYFVTPLASLFTNSSCGIFPTISCNFDIANFPNASLGVTGKYDNGRITADVAIYNGRGYHGFTGDNCVFRFNPVKDGIFNINSVTYRSNDNYYNLGVSLHWRDSPCTEGDSGMFQKEKEIKDKTHFAIWGYAEQKIVKNLYGIVQYSGCPAIKDGCRNFAGAGLAYKCGKSEIALYSSYADFISEYEWASEITFRYTISEKIYIQPAVHYIHNSQTNGVVGLLRLGIAL